MTKLAALSEMRAKDSIVYGAKSANLGEIVKRYPAAQYSDGFTVPFYWYCKFMKDNDFDKTLIEYINHNDFVYNPRFRRSKLEEFRQMIQNGKFDETLKQEIIAKWKTQLKGKPVFVRSSSNAEDLENSPVPGYIPVSRM